MSTGEAAGPGARNEGYAPEPSYSAETVVVGGGISGLTAAYELSRRREAHGQTVLLEAGSGPGGKVISARQEGMLCEFGPNSLRGSSNELWHLIQELGLDERVVVASDAARRRYILKGGRLIPLPTSPGEALRTSLLSTRAKLRILGDMVIGRGSGEAQSVSAFVRRRFGWEPLRFAIDPFVAGIYAGDADALEMGDRPRPDCSCNGFAPVPTHKQDHCPGDPWGTRPERLGNHLPEGVLQEPKHTSTDLPRSGTGLLSTYQWVAVDYQPGSH